MNKILFAFLFLYSYSAIAYSPSCSKDGTVVIYSNGLDSNEEHTEDGAKKLKDRSSFLNKQIDKGAEDPNKLNHVTYTFHHNARFQDGTNSNLLDRYIDFIASAKLLVKNKAKQDYKLTLDEEKQLEFVKRLEGFGLDAAPQGGSYTAVFTFLLEWYAQYQSEQIESSILANPENNANELTERYRRY